MAISPFTQCVGCGKTTSVIVNFRDDGVPTPLCRWCHHSLMYGRLWAIRDLISRVFAGDSVAVEVVA